MITAKSIFVSDVSNNNNNNNSEIPGNINPQEIQKTTLLGPIYQVTTRTKQPSSALGS